ncbi:MAG: sugar phosphate isomerase/epimerase family protein [Phycisphaerales bacterium]
MSTVGVCAWSLRPEGPRDLCDKLAAAGLSAVQLALDPLRTGQWSETETVATLSSARITILSGMMATAGEDYSTLDTIRQTGGLRPDRTWHENLAAATANAELAHRLRIPLITLHAGFLPHHPADPLRATMLDRLRQVAAAFAANGIQLALETGQESAPLLLDYLTELNSPGRSALRTDPSSPGTPALRADIGVNFDPANMLLYGTGDPIDALRLLSPHILQVHIKDARRTTTPGQWGTETPAGRGEVPWPAFFAALRAIPRPVNLLIERESGDTRLEDIRAARRLIETHATPTGAPR